MTHIAINGWFVGQSTTGSGQYIDHLLTHLPRYASAVRWSLLLPPHAMREASRLAAVAPTVAVQPVSLPPLPAPLAKLWWEQVTIPHMARRLSADLLWVPYWAAPLWQPTPVTVTIHDLIPALLPAYRGGWLQRMYTALVSVTARRAAAVITVSHASKRDIVTHLRIPNARVHVIYHGPNQEGAPQPDAAVQMAVRQKFTLPQRFFLYVGGFDVRKNVRATLEGYARYLARGGDPGVQLVIAGKLPTVDSLFTPDPQRLAAELGLHGQVHFCGWVDELEKAALYAMATAYVFPSLYEGFGMMVLEAMCAGAPVVTSAESANAPPARFA